MRSRRPCRRRHLDAFLRALQRQRLLDIAEGRGEPVCQREQWFQWSLGTSRPPRPDDFILPPVLFLAECELESAPPTAS